MEPVARLRRFNLDRFQRANGLPRAMTAFWHLRMDQYCAIRGSIRNQAHKFPFGYVQAYSTRSDMAASAGNGPIPVQIYVPPLYHCTAVPDRLV